MANVQAAFGLRPIRHLNGNPWNGATERCLVEDNYATAVFVGDPIIYTGTATSDDASQHYKAVNVATEGDTNRIYGVVVGIEPNRDNLSRTYIPASTGGYVYVCVDPDVIYAVADEGGANLTGDAIGANAVLEAGSGGSTVTGLSSWCIDTDDTPAADASNQVLIMALHPKDDNEVATYAVWEVLITNHVLRGGIAANNEGALGI